MDARTAACLIAGLSLTNEWRLAVEIIDEQKEDFYGSNQADCSLLIRRAFDNNEPDIGFRLLGILATKTTFNIGCKVFLAYWDFCSRQTSDVRKHIEKMLELIQTEQLIVTKKTIGGLYTLLGDIGVPLTYTAVHTK